jgi:hypothetical protein
MLRGEGLLPPPRAPNLIAPPLTPGGAGPAAGAVGPSGVASDPSAEASKTLEELLKKAPATGGEGAPK